ncbi:MAG: hypothetical protein Q9163_000238 [Psora crenata]
MATAPSLDHSLEALPAMLNLVLVQTGKILRDPILHNPQNISLTRRRVREFLPPANYRFYDALDEIEIEILEAKAVIERDLHSKWRKRVERERQASKTNTLGCPEDQMISGSNIEGATSDLQNDAQDNEGPVPDEVMADVVEHIAGQSKDEACAKEPVNMDEERTIIASEGMPQDSQDATGLAISIPQNSKLNGVGALESRNKGGIDNSKPDMEMPAGANGPSEETANQDFDFDSMFNDADLVASDEPMNFELDFAANGNGTKALLGENTTGVVTSSNNTDIANALPTTSEELNSLLPGLEAYANTPNESSINNPAAHTMITPEANQGSVGQTTGAKTQAATEPVQESAFDEFFNLADLNAVEDSNSAEQVVGDGNFEGFEEFNDDWFKIGLWYNYGDPAFCADPTGTTCSLTLGASELAFANSLACSVRSSLNLAHLPHYYHTIAHPELLFVPDIVSSKGLFNLTIFRKRAVSAASHTSLKMLIIAVAIIYIGVLAWWTLLWYLEKRNYWTLRLRLSLVYEYITTFCCVGLLAHGWEIWPTLSGRPMWSQNSSGQNVGLWHLSVFLALCGTLAFFYLNLRESRQYRKLRWKAWTGPSRTGIPSSLTQYIGHEQDWAALERSVGQLAPHPVEGFLRFASPFSRGVISDPTALLKARSKLDNKTDTVWLPSSETKSSIYWPDVVDKSVSLLWGGSLGFEARCSRGIIAVPRPLLHSSPTLDRGIDGRPVCLAYAVLSRNKGLEPSTLVINLESKHTFRAFEEYSSFWPRPSKTLRGFYRREFAGTFSLLGTSYVAGATELALLFADVPGPLIEDWLSGGMEHQDIQLNRKAAEEGASIEDLARLYRGHYAAMLISLSLHRQGLRLRPELLVLNALCGLENTVPPAWSLAPWAIQRAAQEENLYDMVSRPNRELSPLFLIMYLTLTFILLVLDPCVAAPAQVDRALFVVGPDAQNAFLWSSVGLAVVTALLQGLVTALAFMTESSNYWTFRFRLAKIEHWWWAVVSALLLVSLVLITLSFLSGNSSEAISILALSTATFLTIVQYAIPSWRTRKFIENRWQAWTGSSRTSIPASKAGFCGSKKHWEKLLKEVNLSNIKPTPSDWYGWHLLPARGIRGDPTDILRNLDANCSNLLARDEDRSKFIYRLCKVDESDVSLLWGEEQGFGRRVSRATSSMPSGLLQSRPFTVDGYVGNGLCLAMGVLGRNKGLSPKQLVFHTSRAVTTGMENFGTWAPRPNKVLRSYYAKALQEQYGGLGEAYVSAATELALLFMDVPPAATASWLKAGAEHQSIIVNKQLADAKSDNKEAEMKAHYESSYVSMIISLNYMDKRIETSEASARLVSRPDLICTGLLLKARGEPEPLWWNDSDLAEARDSEIYALEGESWKESMALLLGLSNWPLGFENHPSIWDG